VADDHGGPPLLPEDTTTIDEIPEVVWDRLRGSRILVTGGTGFVGTWLIAGLARANRVHRLGASIVVVSRHPEAFLDREPWVRQEAWVTFSQGDARRLPTPLGDFSHAILGAAPADAKVTRERPQSVMETVLSGAAGVLRAVPKASALLLSSGAVYGEGEHRPDLIPEGFRGSLDWLDPSNAYHEAKRAAEAMTMAAGVESGMNVTIARLFAFHGPWLPTDRHFAVGNFIRDAIDGHDIVIRGDGTPVRSYLYAADMLAWLLTILARGESGRAYNVGSGRGVSVSELADLVAATMPTAPRVRILGEPGAGGGGQRYVPDVTRARDELGLLESVSLEDGLARTVRWLSARQGDAWA
jgi:dTDP-glucose 4,6-dehydratase